MIPASFDYSAPGALEDALASLSEYGDEAKVLAGGQSLLPLMKLRFATPTVLIDLRRLHDLRFIRETDGFIEVGSMTRYVDLERSEVIRDRLPLLHQAVPLIGDVQVRNRGTIGGSIAHGDPAGDMPALVCALNATIESTSSRGSRSRSAQDFFVDIFTTALEPDEIVTKLSFPVEADTRQHYEKYRLRLCDWAIVGAAFSGRLDGGRLAAVRLALSSVGPTPIRAYAVEEALEGAEPDPETIASACALVTEGLDPTPEIQASREYKLHLATVTARRAIENALATHKSDG